VRARRPRSPESSRRCRGSQIEAGKFALADLVKLTDAVRRPGTVIIQSLDSGVERHRQRHPCVDAAVGVLLHRQAATVHQQRLAWADPPLPHRRGTAAGMKLVEVDAQRHREDVRCVDAFELFARERGRAHHGVIARGGAAVCGIGDRTRQARRKYLSDKAIEAFVGDHDGGHVVSSAPPAQRSQGQPV
jgi:hypothetical protein